jgi:MbtH protein
MNEHVFEVVVNHEGQYSVWATEQQVPLGWRLEGKRGSLDECLKYTQEAWVDMRPLSLVARQAQSD